MLLYGVAPEPALDRAALEIARIEYPALDIEKWVAELDRHAFTIAGRAEDLADGRSFVEAANAYLFGELGLAGNKDNYYDPANSCLNRVLETGLGIPIALSVIYIEIARRLAKPVYGVGLPGHFVLGYDDGEFATFIDPFHGGALLDEAGCCTLLGVESIDASLLAPMPPRRILIRMLHNLRQIYFSRQDSARALQVLDHLLSLDEQAVEEHKQRAAVLLALERMTESLEAFRRYLELAPDATDRQNVEEQMRSLAFWIASRN